MTTITYRDGVLAADSQISYGSFRNGKKQKIQRTTMPVGGRFVNVMIAMAGACWAISPMVQWIEGGASQDDIPHTLLHKCTTFSCLLITEDGDIFEFNEGYFVECDAEYHSIGSGQMFALGAMAYGANAPEAVAAAAKHDKATGGEINIMTLTDLKTNKEAA